MSGEAKQSIKDMSKWIILCISTFIQKCREGFVSTQGKSGLASFGSRFTNLWRSGVHGKLALCMCVVLLVWYFGKSNHSKMESPDAMASQSNQVAPVQPKSLRGKIQEDPMATLIMSEEDYELLESPEVQWWLQQHENWEQRNPPLVCRKCSTTYQTPMPGIISYSMQCSAGGEHVPR